jgi:AsmA protein
MKRALKIILILVGVFVVLLLVLPFVIPVNSFRPTIEQKASEALGRKVTVGNLSLSLISGSVAAENLSISDDPKFSSSPFLTAKSLKVGVEILPLIFSKTLNVTDITIENPEVTLLHSPSGQWNYSSIGGAAGKSEQKAASKSSKTSSSSSPSDSSSSSSAAGQLSIGRLELKDGRITVGSTNSQKRSVYDHVNVTASDVSLTTKFPVTVTAELPDGGKFKLDGTAGPVDEADAALTPVNAKLNVTGLNLASTGFLDPSLGLGGIADLDADLASQNGEAETKGTVRLSKALLVAGGSPAGVPATVDFSTKYNLRKMAGVLNPSTLKIGNAAAHLNGTYETGGDTPVVNVKLDAKDMPAKDLEAFLPALGIHLPKGASLESGTMNADFTISGPTNRLVTTGDTGIFNGKLAGFDLGSKMKEVASLAGIKSTKDLDIEKITSNLRIAPDGIRADNFLAVLPTIGNLTGAGTIDSRNALDFKMIATLTTETSAAGATGTGGGSSGSGGLGGLLSKVTGASGDCNSGLKVPFQIQGTTAEPKFIPDVGGAAASLFKSELGCLGGGSSSASGQQQKKNPLGALGGLLKQKP